jgi:hypothetical protein
VSPDRTLEPLCIVNAILKEIIMLTIEKDTTDYDPVVDELKSGLSPDLSALTTTNRYMLAFASGKMDLLNHEPAYCWLLLSSEQKDYVISHKPEWGVILIMSKHHRELIEQCPVNPGAGIGDAWEKGRRDGFKNMENNFSFHDNYGMRMAYEDGYQVGTADREHFIKLDRRPSLSIILDDGRMECPYNFKEHPDEVEAWVSGYDAAQTGLPPAHLETKSENDKVIKAYQRGYRYGEKFENERSSTTSQVYQKPWVA